MRTAVYTAIAGDYNELRDHPDIGDDVDWVAFVTQPTQYESSNWDVRPLFSYGEEDPRRQAKWYKVQSGLEMAEYDRTLWLDGSVEILQPRVLQHLLVPYEDAIGAVAPIEMYRHTDRDCAYQEAGFSLGMTKYRNEPLREQAQYYLDEYDHPEHVGLWFTTVIARNRCPNVDRIERAWWSEIDRWSVQDQVSLPVVLRYLGIKVRALPPKTLSQTFKFHQQPFST